MLFSLFNFSIILYNFTFKNISQDFYTVFHLKSYICCEEYCIIFPPLFPFLLSSFHSYYFFLNFFAFPLILLFWCSASPSPLLSSSLYHCYMVVSFALPPLILKWKRFCPRVIFGSVCRCF